MTRFFLLLSAFWAVGFVFVENQCCENLIKEDDTGQPFEYESGGLENESQRKALAVKTKENLSDDEHQLFPRSNGNPPRSNGSPPRSNGSPSWSNGSPSRSNRTPLPPGPSRLQQILRMPTSFQFSLANGNFDWGRMSATAQRTVGSLQERVKLLIAEYTAKVNTNGFLKYLDAEETLDGSQPLRRRVIKIPSGRKPREPKAAKPPEPLLDCLARAISTISVAELAMSSATSVMSSIPLIGQHFEPEPGTETPSSTEIVQRFLNEAMPCFGYFKLDENGNFQFDPNVAMREAVGAARKNPDLALAAANAVVENITVKKNWKGQPHYDINFPGLATSLAMAYAGSTSLGQYARSLSRTSSVREPVEPEDTVLQCLSKAIAIVPLGPLALTSATDVASSIPFVGGYVPKPGTKNAKAMDIVRIFVDAAMPCFKYFKKNDEGYFEFDHEYAMGSAVRMAKQDPGFTVSVAEAVVHNVHLTLPMEAGKNPEYDIDYPGLLTGLGAAVVESTKDKINQMVNNFYGKDSGTSLKQSGRKRDPQENLIKCLAKAVVNVPLGSMVLSSATSFASTFPFIGKYFEKPTTTVPSASSIAKSFADEARPCFDFFRRGADGSLELDHTYAFNTALEAANWNPITALTVGAAEAVKLNVWVDDDGDYAIDYEGLASGLAMAVVKASKVGRLASVIRLFVQE